MNLTDNTETGDVRTLQDRLWKAVTGRDEHRAADIVLTALEDGVDAETILLDLIAPVQVKVGAQWAANRLSVAQEHAATAITERVIAALAHHPAVRTPPALGRVTVACVDQEWHVLPARLLAEVLTLRGWQVDFLGAQVPTHHLITHLHHHGADAVALSSSLPTRLPTAHAAITACQAIGIPVLTGGAAFGPDGRYARLLGANAWAPDARAAARQLADGIPRPASPPGGSRSTTFPTSPTRSTRSSPAPRDSSSEESSPGSKSSSPRWPPTPPPARAHRRGHRTHRRLPGRGPLHR